MSAIKYMIYEVKQIEVHVSSSDFYARRGDSQEETINTLIPLEECDSFDNGVDRLKTGYINNHFGKGTFTVLPIIEFQ